MRGRQEQAQTWGFFSTASLMGIAEILWSRTLSEGKQGREQRANKDPSIELSAFSHGLHWMLAVHGEYLLCSI